ncbi:tyrosine-type recombinase/integrase [Umezawaea beigongshangensis]|uniref:tyrosine-type recombinase/integrase n=1 Tax=Umezawaea beigongshangensis TaxID=2780383 RepID=UPI0018F1AC20|nr:tyrosine-type recombinase/integrase [Umezawaea beigongshangensis]
MRQELPPRADGSRRSFSRSGYDSNGDAVEDLDRVRALLAIPATDDSHALRLVGDLLEQTSRNKTPIPEHDEVARQIRRLHTGQQSDSRITVAEYLDTWLSGRRKPRPSTMRSYESHVRVHITPALGAIRLDRLSTAAVSEMFERIAEQNAEILESNALRRDAAARLKATRGRAERAAIRAELAALPPFRRITGATTQHRIRATLRKALNDAIREQNTGIAFNPAKWVELESETRPTALVWTPDRVAQWRETGDRPSPVMVWTPEQAGAYLDHVAGDRLYALWHVAVFRGLRRGEACGIRWTDFDAAAGTLTISEQLVQLGSVIAASEPKSRAGHRVIALDEETVTVLRRHRTQQRADQMAWGPAWQGSGRIFTREDGSQLVPDWVTDRHERQQGETDLPPVRMHDLRHTAASLMLAAGVDITVVQETLGHSSSTLTRDTYTSVFPSVARDAAEATARTVPRRARGG